MIDLVSNITEPIVLMPEERSVLDRWSNQRSIPLRLVQRANIIRMAADGVMNKDIALKMYVSRPTVQLWRDRFLALRLKGLEKGAPRPGRIPEISDKKIQAVVEATLHSKPENATHWSVRSMAKAQGLSKSTINRIWREHNLKPHLIETFKLSNDKQFVEKLHDIIGLYLNPPDKAIVLCVDEKSQIQAINRAQPMFPMRPGIPARQTYDYQRHGTTTLFAALSMLDGKVIGQCMTRHRHQEFIRFLKRVDSDTSKDFDLHLIVDNYGTHKHKRVKSWLKRHSRFHLHFTPTSSSWLNMVERWFRDLSTRQIRRGSFQSVPSLIQTIDRYITSHNQNPKIFIWSASAQQIMNKISKVKKC